MIASLLALLLVPFSLIAAIVVLGWMFWHNWRHGRFLLAALCFTAIIGQGFLLAETAFFFTL